MNSPEERCKELEVIIGNVRYWATAALMAPDADLMKAFKAIAETTDLSTDTKQDKTRQT